MPFLRYFARYIRQPLLLSLLCAISISSCLSQTAGRVDNVQPGNVLALVSGVLQAHHHGLHNVEMDTHDLVSNYEEFRSYFLPYRAHFRFRLEGNSLLVTMEDLQAPGKGTWNRSLITANAAEAKLIAQMVDQLTAANRHFASSPVETVSTPIGNSDGFKRSESPDITANTSPYDRLIRYSSSYRLPQLEKAKPLVFEATPDTRCAEGMCAIRKNGLWGFTDYQGNLVLDFRYHLDSVPVFSQGRCMVFAIGPDNRPLGMTYIDKKGNLLFGKKIFRSARPFSNGVTIISIVEKGKGYAREVLDPQGQIVGFFPPAVNVDLADERDFHDGLILARDLRQSGKSGFLNAKMQWIANPVYSQAQEFSEGIAWVRASPQGGEYKWGAINIEGKVIIPFVFSKDPEPFSEGLAHVTCSDDKSGFVDRTGKLAIPCQYTEVGRFVNGHVRAHDAAKEATSLIDKQGNVVITFREIVVNQNLVAKIGALRGDGLYPFYVTSYPGGSYSASGLLDGDWNFVITPVQNMTIGLFPADGNQDGLAWATYGDQGGKTVQGLINRRGEFVLVQQNSMF